MKSFIVFCLLLCPVNILAQDKCLCEKSSFEKSLVKSTLVIVAEVKNANFSSGVWSSGTLSEKMVEYKVVNVIKGEFKGASVFVLFPILQKYNWVANNKPQLSNSVFQNSSRHLLLLVDNRYPNKPMDKQNRAIVGNEQWFIPAGECFALAKLEDKEK